MNKIGIIGLGYVGLPLAIRFAELDYKVIGFDIDAEKINKITSGKSYIRHITHDSVAKAVGLSLEGTTNFARIAEVDAIIICVPTPLDKYRVPDLTYILGTMASILPFVKKGQVLSLESTTYPGTTDEQIVPLLEQKGFKIGEDFYVVFSPEREDPGNQGFTTATIPKVVGGYTKKCLELGVELYSKIINKVVPVSSTKVAEMSKLLENIHRSVNIGLVNEMKIIADKMDIDIYEVIDAAATKPFGFTAFYPGPGLGGHCLPIDPFYLTWKAKEFGLHTRFIELAGEINRDMPEWVVNKIVMGLNQVKKAINGSKVLAIGAAYKKNIDDARESPSIEVIEYLLGLGADVEYHDDFITELPHMRRHYLPLKSIKLNTESIKKYDAIVIMTDHDYIDYQQILENSQLIIDTRGRYRGNKNAKVIHA